MSKTAEPSFLDPKRYVVMSLKELVADIDKSISDIAGAEVTTDASGESIKSLKKSYTDLKETINAQITSWSTTDVASLGASVASYTSQKEALDKTRQNFIKNGKLDLTFSGIARATALATLEKFATASIISAFIFGGIVMSNNFLNETTILLRAFYFIYGGALFPVSLIYGTFYTPTWHSALFPLFEKTKMNIPLFSYKTPSALDPSGGNKMALRICCIINLILVFVSISLLSS